MLNVVNVSKSFPGVQALSDVSIKFNEKEIHALLGENGAGKSTLIKIICGIYKPDFGELLVNNKRIRPKSYRDAINMSISYVSQELRIIPNMTVAENIMLDKLENFRKVGFINWTKVNNAALEYIEKVGLNVIPSANVNNLSVSQKQLIEIARALVSNSSILILDEPTASISKSEIDRLFNILKVFKDKGSTIIYVTHKLEEVFLICDNVSVLRDGKLIGTNKIENLNKESIIEMMVGRKLKLSSYGDLSVTDELALEVKELFKKDKADNINFSLFKGEILGFYGLVGSGRTEVAKLIVGLDKKDRGNIFIKGKKVIINTLFDGLYKHKLGYISENRKEEGLLLNSDVKTNICITLWQKIVSRLLKFVSGKKELEISKEWVKNLDIKISSLNQKAVSLSGGNQQKVSLSKWLAADCDILIIDEPTVGVDVGAKEAIHEIIFNMAKKENKSVILISSDMPEIIKLSSRILVFRDKRIVGEIENINSASDYSLVGKKIGSYLH